MNKSVYSIVLTDSVVQKIDELARKQGTNRSALINKILAESLSVETPEKRYTDIYRLVNNIFSSSAFSILDAQAENSLAVSSIMNYKYNPTVRYQVELYRNDVNGKIGKLRINLRTRNAPLLERLDIFFRLWSTFEAKYLANIMNTSIKYEKEDTRFARELMIPRKKHGVKVYSEQAISMDDIAEAIAEYIKGFDRVMKCWFEYSDDYRRASVIAESEYADFIKKADYVI